MISSIICMLFFLNRVSNLQDYLYNHNITKSTENIDFVLKQVPPIIYNGKEISISNYSKPLIIKNKYG